MPYDYGGESFGRGLQFGQSLAAPFLQAKQTSEAKRMRGEDVERQQRWRTEDITRGARQNTLQAWIARKTARDTLYANLMTPRQDPNTKEWSTPDETQARSTVDAIFPPMPVPKELTEVYPGMETPKAELPPPPPPPGAGLAADATEGGGVGIGGMLALGGAAGAGAYLGGPRLARAIKGTPPTNIAFEGMNVPPQYGKAISEVEHASEYAPEVTKLQTPYGRKLPITELKGEGGRFTAEIPGKPGILSRIGRWFGKVPKSSLGKGGMAGTGFINPRDIEKMLQAREWERGEKEGRVKHWRPEDFPREPFAIPGFPRRSVSRRY